MFEQLNSLMVQYHVWAILATLFMLAFIIKLVLDGLKEAGVVKPDKAGKWNIAINSLIGVLTFLFQFFNQQILLTDAQGAAEVIAPKVTFVFLSILATKGVHELLKWVLGQPDDVTPPDAGEKPVIDAIGPEALAAGVQPGISPGTTVQPVGRADMHLVPNAHKRTGNEEPPELNYEDLGDNGMPPGQIAA